MHVIYKLTPLPRLLRNKEIHVVEKGKTKIKVISKVCHLVFFFVLFFNFTYITVTVSCFFLEN